MRRACLIAILVAQICLCVFVHERNKNIDRAIANEIALQQEIDNYRNGRCVKGDCR